MARFDRISVYQAMLGTGLVPLFYHADLETAKQVCAACAEGGARLLEFTNRGEKALPVFAGLVEYAEKAFPEMILGVGSVVDAPTAALYIAYGANFVVGPLLNPEIARLCNRRKIPYLPGCGTVSEISQAEELGAEIVKVFPGGVGGPDFIKAVKGPLPWTRIMPTGGVEPTAENVNAWIKAGAACLGMGSGLIRSDWVKAKDFHAIRENVVKALALVQGARGK